MKKYKVLQVIDGRLISPYRGFDYGKMEDVLGREMVCEEFDTDETMKCARRFYTTDIDGLIYTLNMYKDCRVFEVEMGGRSVIHNTYKQGFEKQTIIRMLPKSEVRELIREQSDKMDWDYYRACYPINPLELDIPFNKDKALKLLKEWASVGASVGESVWASVRDSMGASVWYSVRDSVWTSVRTSVQDSVRDFVGDSVYAYISSLFPNIKKWKYIEHKEGVNPFQSGIDLWHMGLIPSFDGKVWRLHKGKNAEVVLEISEEELER
jgi:hypothetical protein